MVKGFHNTGSGHVFHFHYMFFFLEIYFKASNEKRNTLKAQMSAANEELNK
jgi:hypothetical protein